MISVHPDRRHSGGRVRKTRRTSLMVSSALLLLPLFSPLYGCRDSSSEDFPNLSDNIEASADSIVSADSADSAKSVKTDRINFDSAPTDFSDSKPSSDPQNNDIPWNESDLTDLRGAAEPLSGTFQDEKGGETERADKSNGETLNVSEEIQERYSHLPDLSFAPKIVERIGEEGAPRRLLRYQFDPGTELRWNVSHRVWKRVLMADHESEIETVSQIIRRWRIDGTDKIAENGAENSEAAADPTGQHDAAAEEIDKTDENSASEGERGLRQSDNQNSDKYNVEYYIDEMNLEQHETGKDPVLFNSRLDVEVPPEFSYFGIEKAVATALERFKIDSFGMMTEKKKIIKEFGGAPKDSRVMFPFPAEPVAVGETWTLPFTIFLKNQDKTIKTVNAIQKFTLENITGDLATISVRTIPTSIIGDPYLEGQLAERLFTGSCRFDIARGKTVRTEIEFSRAVPEAYGQATFLDYRCRVVEEWIRE